MHKKKIIFITGSRADYGLLKILAKKIKTSKKFSLYFLVTGSHLSNKFGKTIEEIKTDGFKINGKIDLNLEINNSNINKILSIGVEKFSTTLKKIKPTAILLLGDRYELLAPVIASFFLRIPIIHLHGGEITKGSLDDSIRHVITKFSNLHFVSNNESKVRVTQMGENPKKVFNVGALGVDAISHIKISKKKDLEKKYKISLINKKIILVTYHPNTLDVHKTDLEFKELLKALNKFNKYLIIFTSPNSDIGNNKIIKLIKDFIKFNTNTYFIKSLGQIDYYTFLKISEVLVGNSSSGILEAPSFKTPSVNIGLRQLGRLKAKSVIDVKNNHKLIYLAIKRSLSKRFISNLNEIKNPYGKGGASSKILQILSKEILDLSSNKDFYDLNNIKNLIKNKKK